MLMPPTKVYFRADKRFFISGQPITTAGQFNAKHPPHGKQAEEFLEGLRPADKPERVTSLMLFESEAVAREHCAKMTGGNLYQVQIDEDAILHRADMRLVDTIGAEFMAGTQPAETLGNDYWSGTMTQKPIVEVLVKQGVVVADLGYSQAERKAYFRECLGIKPHQPDDLDYLFSPDPNS
jgi:hypothetical protein